MRSVLATLIFMTLLGCSYAQSPENKTGGESTPPTSPNPPAKPLPPDFVLEPNFESIKTGILDQKCVQCHSPGGKAERIPLLTREDLLDSPHEIVIPGNSEESGIILVLQPNARKPMPPKNSKKQPVTEEEQRVLREWIEAGAKD